MKSFKQFIKEKIKPIIVDELPVHGSHAHDKEHSEKTKLKEGAEEDRDHQHFHLGYSEDEFKKKHEHSHESWEHLNHGYKQTKHEASHSRYRWEREQGDQVTSEIGEYTGSSSHLNHALINHATGAKPSHLQPYHKFKQLSKEAGHYTIEARESHKQSKEHLKVKINRLDHAMKKSKLKEPTRLLSGVGFNPDHYASQHPDRHIHLPAYTSASSNSRIGRYFGGRGAKIHQNEQGHDVEHSHVLRIHLPKGHKALHVLGKSNLPGEHETILPRNMKLKISEKPYHVEHGNNYGTPIVHHYWDAHPVKETKTK